MPNFNRFTIKTQETLQNAQELVGKLNHGDMRALHLLSALLEDESTLVRPILTKANVNLEALDEAVELGLENLPPVFGRGEVGQIYLAPEVIRVLDRSGEAANSLQDQFISCEHLLTALSEVPSPARDVLSEFGLNKEKILKIFKELRGANRVTDETPESKFRVLEKYSVNLTQKARDGKLDPLIGRDEELRRVMQILSRRTKNNPALIGEPGVGKTSIVEGLAQRIVAGDVPEPLKNKELLTLDLGAMIAGTKFRGEFEDRLRAFLKEVQTSDGKILLFIDEIHMIVGAGATDGGTMDASNLLKPALARGELRAIGATTLKEYQRHIEKDSALERRFQPIIVEEPSVEDSVAILRGLKEKYEVHHGLKITDEAIIAAVSLSARYLPDRFLPDKAVDLIDEAAASRRLESESLPGELDKARREITRLEIEKSALQGEGGKKKIERLKEVNKKLASLRAENKETSGRWEEEKKSLEKFHEVRKRIEDLRLEATRAEREGNLERVARIIYGELPQAEKEQKEFEKKNLKTGQVGKFIRETVSEEDIALVVSRWTGVPVSRMLESEMQKLVRLEEELKARVVGQDEAVTAVSRALRRSRAGLSDEDRPVGSFLFLGPTGVGKTELAKALAEFMFNDEKALVRIDMSEYMERHAVSRLVGSPPGYVGHEEGGQLTDIVRHRPYSLILFDEIEKAHPEVFNILLQVLDNGRLTDGKGKTVNFRNSVIILTSNVGSSYFRELSQLGFDAGKGEVAKLKEDEFRVRVDEALRETFRPEFLNRLDETVIFRALTPKDIEAIVDIQLDRVEKRLKEKGIKMTVRPAIKKYLAEHGFNPDYGARPVKRFIQKVIVDALADKLVRGEIKEGSKAIVDLNARREVVVKV